MLNGVRATEKMFLPVVRAVVDRELRAWCDSFQGPDIRFGRMFVSADLHICPVHKPVVNPPPPAVGVCWVGIDDDGFLPSSSQRLMVIEVRPDVGEVLPRRV